MKRTALLLSLGLSLFANQALAGFGNWTAVVEDDPFSGGKNVTIDYITSLRSGVFLSCDSSTKVLEIKIVAGWEYISDLQYLEPEVQVMIDGTMIGTHVGRTGAFGDNIAGAVVELSGEEADKFIQAFMASKKQIAFKDGISDGPHLLKARGSTKAGQQMTLCLNGPTATN